MKYMYTIIIIIIFQNYYFYTLYLFLCDWNISRIYYKGVKEISEDISIRWKRFIDS